MDKFISESMRHGNFVTFIERACTKNYKVIIFLNITIVIV